LKIIDAHAHIYPDKIAKKAAENIGLFYDIPMCEEGTVGRLLEIGRECGIGRFLVHSVATVPDQVQSINNFIARQVAAHPDKLVGFATIHPDYEDIEGEVERILSLGLKGFKIHPDFQKFNIDSKNAMHLYEVIEGRLPILVHTGDFRYEFSKPWRMAAVVDRFPGLQVICAHFGGWSEWEDAAKALAGKNVLVDTSSSLYQVKPKRARELIDLFGVDNVLFGTDYPMWEPKEELERIARVELSPEEREKIMYKNAERVLGL